MYRANYTATREKRTKDRQHECGKDQPHIPDLQHAALFLHHDRMQECRAREPRQERGIFDGIPTPIAAPTQHGISPMRAEEDAAGQKSPGHHRPTAGNVNPLFSGIAHDQRTQRKGERNGEAHVAQIQHGRVNHHLGILQERVQSIAIFRQ